MPRILGRGLGALAALFGSCDGLLARSAASSAASAELLEDLDADAGALTEGVPFIWVHSYARSGSSTILSMVSLEAQGSRTFSLFEPCNPRDVLSKELANMGCIGMLAGIKDCDFRGITSLDGWNDVHSKRGDKRGQPYSQQVANAACSASDKIALKTITKAFHRSTITADDVRFIETEKRIKMLDVIRDPRSIFSSWLSTFPFNDTKLGGVGRDTDAMIFICDDMAMNIELDHPQVHRIVFEDMVKDPRKTLEETYEFLGLDVTDEQRRWVSDTFNAQDCPGVDVWIAPYSDCHTDSLAALEKWRDVLTHDEKLRFSSHPQCQKVARTYGFSLD